MKVFTVIFLTLTWVSSLPDQMHAQEPKVEGDENPKPESEVSKAKGSVELQALQGTWEGVLVSDEAKITITITGDSLHFHRDKDFWFETTIILPEGKAPKQLHATIVKCAEPDSVGEVVRAFFKIEDGTLTLATIGEDTEETQKAFEAARTRYELLRIQPQTKNSRAPK